METALAHESVHVQEGAAAAEPSVSGQRLTSRKSNGASLKEAVQMKTEGNAFYKEKNLRSAIRRYHSALLVLRGLDSDLMSSLKGFGPETPPLTPEQETLLRNIQVDCYNNLAACLLLKGGVDYSRVQEYSLRVLRWQPRNVKALYRAGVATLELGDAQTAKEYLTQASREQPNDVNVKKYLQRAEQKLNQELQKEKAMYRGMFSSNIKSSSGDGVNHSQESGD